MPYALANEQQNLQPSHPVIHEVVAVTPLTETDSQPHWITYIQNHTQV